ncbi:DUF4435 domain-containing protein [Sphingomonas sp. LR55]|uniref:DUF4435 domain-containing protein n=1 Tax=Sphingomonas sp. LR55 TaxID=3050231 RepID=UPI002FE0F5FD
MIDPYVSSRIAAKRRPSVIKTKLLNLRSKFPNGLIIAVEGVDDKVVYSKWIERVSPQIRYEFLVCGGKRQVRDLRNVLVRDRNNLEYLVKMIVDRDFNDLNGFLSFDRVFMLRRYSVENYLVDSVVLDRLLAVAFPCDGEIEIRRSVVAMFEADYAAYLAASKAINERIYVGRQIGIDIDDAMPSGINDFASVELGATCQKDHSPNEVLPYPIEVTDQTWNESIIGFADLIPSERYRGKFALKFFTKWLDKLAIEFRNPSINIFGLLNANGTINHTEISLGGHASRALIPDDFREFIEDYR